MRWLRRRSRSVGFRAGLISAVLVGLDTTIVAFVVVAVVFGSAILAVQSLQIAAHERGLDQLGLGVDPDDLDLGTIETDQEGSSSFWAVLQNGDVVHSEGGYDEAVLRAPFETEEGFVRVEADPDSDLRQGDKKIDGRTWTYFEGDVAFEGVSYTLVTATDTGFTYWGFFREGLPLILAATLVTSVAAGLLTALFSRLTLRSVEQMRVEVQQISRESLDRRVPTTGAGDGVDKLAHTMNDMLGRLETSSSRQSEFLASASHELRSPVAGLLAQLDVAVAYPERVDTDALLPKLRAEAQRLRLLVDDLLYLSRSEALSTDRPPPARSAVDVDELLAREAEHLRELYEHVTVTVNGVTGVQLAGQERDLSRAVRNLAENAARHAERSVELGISLSGHLAAVTVSDDGAGVAAEDAERIFDRFVRLDEARGRDDGGSGLGLAIVREIARQHGGEVAVIDEGRPGATFRLLVPLA